MTVPDMGFAALIVCWKMQVSGSCARHSDLVGAAMAVCVRERDTRASDRKRAKIRVNGEDMVMGDREGGLMVVPMQREG